MFVCPGTDYTYPGSIDFGYICQFCTVTWGHQPMWYWTSSRFGYGNLNTQPQQWWPKTRMDLLRNGPVAYMFETYKGTSEPDWAYCWGYGRTKYNHDSGFSSNVLWTDGHVTTHRRPIDRDVRNGELKVW